MNLSEFRNLTLASASRAEREGYYGTAEAMRKMLVDTETATELLFHALSDDAQQPIFRKRGLDPTFR